MPKSQTLVITVDSARGLRGRHDSPGPRRRRPVSEQPPSPPDLFVVVCFDGDTSCALAETHVAPATRSPAWEAVFHIELARATRNLMRMGATPRVLSFVICDASTAAVVGTAEMSFEEVARSGAGIVQGDVGIDSGGEIYVSVENREAERGRDRKLKSFGWSALASARRGNKTDAVRQKRRDSGLGDGAGHERFPGTSSTAAKGKVNWGSKRKSALMRRDARETDRVHSDQEWYEA